MENKSTKKVVLTFIAVSGVMLSGFSLLAGEEKVPVILATRNIKTPSLDVGERLYMHYCIPCHGVKGDGKGFNAEFLDPKPANHTDVVEMSKRTDEKLFDTIYGGGKEVAKSTYMPPWGGTFTEAQIKSLVLKLRRLCGCQGPDG